MKKLGILFLAVVVLGGVYYITQGRFTVPSDWETYQNDKFGFRYPDNISICNTPEQHREGEEVVLVLGLYRSPNCDPAKYDPSEIRVSIIKVDGTMSVVDLFPQKFLRAKNAKNYYSIRFFNIGGLKAYGGEMKFDQGSEYGALILKGDRLMIIESPFYIYPSQTNVSTKLIVDRMISTFKFESQGF